MHKLALLAAAAVLSAAGLLSSPAAQAAPLASPAALQTAADGLSTVDSVQYFYAGRRHCWYDDGWRGPGFYWCGYAHRHGFGWGGGPGYRGWARPGVRVVGPRAVVRVRPHGVRVAPRGVGRPAMRGHRAGGHRGRR